MPASIGSAGRRKARLPGTGTENPRVDGSIQSLATTSKWGGVHMMSAQSLSRAIRFEPPSVCRTGEAALAVSDTPVVFTDEVSQATSGAGEVFAE